MLKAYYQLTKPGIIYGNAMTAIAGFLLASKTTIDLGLLLATTMGISFVIASACVVNNYIDRSIDKKMARTKKRALVTGAISGTNAIIYAIVLGCIGFALLALYTNWLTALLGVIGYVDYIVLYGIYKRRSVHGTIIGSISGAVPIAAGYCAVTDRFDSGAVILFLILVFWQMPHFYAIAIGRLKDYSAAGLPVLPVKYGSRNAKIQTLLYIVAFLVAIVMLSVYGYTGYMYLAVMSIAGCIWLWYALQGFSATNDTQWARKLFRFSLIIILVFSVLVSFGTRIA